MRTETTMMKIKRTVRSLVAIPMLVTATACGDSYDDLFLNPDRSTQANIEYLFSQVLTGAELQIGYWEGYYRIYRNISRWGQLTGTVNDEHMMREDATRWGDYWRSYYADRSMWYREMGVIHESMPEEDRAEYEVYLHLGKVIHAYQTSRMTDLWGDMPYTEAFTARNPEDQRNLKPAYDSQEAIYDIVLQDLKDASDALSDPGLVTHGALATQDLLLGGDLMQWQRFVNSLRLRLAMRLSEVAPDKARAVVQEILTGGYPLVESNAQNIVWHTTEEHGGDDRGRPTRESEQQTYAPKLMLDRMLAADDPRIPVLFAPADVTGEYVGLPSSPDAQPAPDNISRDQFAYLNPILFEQHPTYPGVLFTAAEVSFLLAEIYQRGWAAGDAGGAHARGLEQSVEFYYDLYNSNPSADPVDHPDAATVNAFVASSPASYDGTLDKIAEQRWIHLGINQPYEAWSEQRRLNVPELPPDRFGGRVLERTVRLMYPSSETSNNRANWQAVSDKDKATTAVWWDVR